jgi:hypothetical protein
MSNPNFPNALPTPTQAELNATQAAVMSGSSTRPTYAADGSGAARALPPWPHPNGHPPGSIYR